jgi:hypothetical protein
MKFNILSGAALTVLVLAAAPATARRGLFTLSATITNGTDSGNDLVYSDYVNGQLTEHFAPGTIFGLPGSLAGQAVSFSFLYDTNAATLPVVAGGVFDDLTADWALAIDPTVTIGGVTQHVILPTIGSGANYTIIPVATFGLIDSAPDGVTGNFASGIVLSTLFQAYTSAAINFAASAPSTFLSTDALLPGALPTIDHGYASSAATGTGSFSFSFQRCLFSCSYKAATANFAVDHITFADVPEPATWAMLVIGFGAVGLMSRRRATTVVAA